MQAGWAEEALSKETTKMLLERGGDEVHTLPGRQFGKWWMGEAFCGKSWLALVSDI